MVAAGYQASPRGRAGIPWQLDFERDLCFSIVLRPGFPPEREGWLYAAVLTALAEIHPEEVGIAWPDELLAGEERAGAVGVQVGLAPAAIEWAVATVSVIGPSEDRVTLLARTCNAIETALGDAPERVLDSYSARCVTLGRRVLVRVTGVGPDVGSVTGVADSIRADGSLVVVRDDDERRVAVPPAYLWTIEEAPSPSSGRRPFPPPAG